MLLDHADEFATEDAKYDIDQNLNEDKVMVGGARDDDLNMLDAQMAERIERLSLKLITHPKIYDDSY